MRAAQQGHGRPNEAALLRERALLCSKMAVPPTGYARIASQVARYCAKVAESCCAHNSSTCPRLSAATLPKEAICDAFSFLTVQTPDLNGGQRLK